MNPMPIIMNCNIVGIRYPALYRSMERVTNNSKHVRLALRNNTSKTKAFNKG